ncbi:MAG TPA: hypothetical protein VLA45_13985, partial [Paracoccaceae bacterium]|nr:hypothetical protein [Paracoccaceae bacterium]
MIRPTIPEAAVDLADKAAFLKRALACQHVVETHTALVFLTADRAFKLKKPVHLAYLDFRKLAARAHVCREELRLNRQLAGDCYIGLVALRRGADGALTLGPEGEVIDWLIEMERLP